MQRAAKTIGLICVVLTIALWLVTLTTDPTLGSISATVALTAIVAIGWVITSGHDL
jgi:hypothetical protein